MVKVDGSDKALSIFKKELEHSSISGAASTFGLPLHIAYALAGGFNQLTPITVRKILAVDANRSKAARYQGCVDIVESQLHYKGKRDTNKAIEKRNEKYHRDTVPSDWEYME